MVSLMLPLDGDVETHGAVSGAGTAWEAIDEDPKDGDTTYVRILNIGETEASSIDASGLPLGAEVLAVRVRWDASGSTDINDPSFGRAGVRLSGVDYWGTTEMLSPGVYGGSFTVNFGVDPASGQPWSVQQVASCEPIWQLESGATQFQQPRLTQRVLYVDYEPGSYRPEAMGERNAPIARSSIIGCLAVPSSNSPQAVPSSEAAEATGSSNETEGGAI